MAGAAVEDAAVAAAARSRTSLAALQLERTATPRAAAWSRASDGALWRGSVPLGRHFPGGGRASHGPSSPRPEIAAGLDVRPVRGCPATREPIGGRPRGPAWAWAPRAG
jgi:hypothetical protein